MDEKYIVLIFENGLATREQMILEDILGVIGRTNNLSDFPVKLTFEEANIRLVNYNKAASQKWEKVCLLTKLSAVTIHSFILIFDQEQQQQQKRLVWSI